MFGQFRGGSTGSAGGVLDSRWGDIDVVFQKQTQYVHAHAYSTVYVKTRAYRHTPVTFMATTTTTTTTAASSGSERLLIQIASYNTALQGLCGVPQDLVDWLSPTLNVSNFLSRGRRAPDIVAVGFQELLPLHQGRMYSTDLFPYYISAGTSSCWPFE
jgi:hypothetical protein